jgi:hypothetical protein
MCGGIKIYGNYLASFTPILQQRRIRIMRRQITWLALAQVLAIANGAAAMADTVVQETTTTTIGGTPVITSSSSEMSMDVKKGVQYKFKERLGDLKEKISVAEAKGWMNNAQASAFQAEAEKLMNDTSAAELAGWPKDQVDALEKCVTKLNADVATASSN